MEASQDQVQWQLSVG